MEVEVEKTEAEAEAGAAFEGGISFPGFEASEKVYSYPFIYP